MMSRRSIPYLVFAALTVSACVGPASRTSVTQRLDAAIAGEHRSAEDRARDRYRHPRETLLFFGLRPNQTVVEILPVGGWYTRIVAPVLRDRGLYVAAMPPAVAGTGEGSRKAFTDILAAAPAVLDRVRVVDFDIGKGNLVPDGTANLVMTFGNIHDWMAADRAEAAFRDMYRALRPGGTLGVVEHRGNEAVPQDPHARSGYVNQTWAIRLIQSAGFKLVAVSEVNANPRDTKNYSGGVWTLPPTLAAGQADRGKYLAIGESDQFTMKFVRPR